MEGIRLHHKDSYKRQRLLTIAMIFSFGMVLLLRHNREVETVKLYQPEPMLTGTTMQTITAVEPYYAHYETIYDADMYQDEIVVCREGQAGMKETTTWVTYLNGRQVSEEIVEEAITVPAVSRVVKVGTKERPDFIMPVTGYVLTSGLGPRWGRTHNGLDLAVSQGTPVSCTADGMVIQSGWNGGYGISVYVDHGDGIISRYGHLCENSVSVGQQVSQGDLLGYSGNTGFSTGPHLHFEMRLNDVPVNPYDYVTE